MDYTPRYPQPFTLSQAIGLDVNVITEEISRLQNSLKHLRDTQNIIEASLKEEEDSDLRKAFEENQGVIGSQQERISILRMALEEKGILGNAHYDLQSPTQPPTSNSIPATDAPQTSGVTPTTQDDVDSGVYL